LVQYTYHITTNYTQSYTINVYLTKCSHLINGKNTQGLIDRDIPLIHYIISNTQCLIDRDIPLIHYIISNTQGLIDRDIPLIHCIISNTQGLIDRDIPLIHYIISNTQCLIDIDIPLIHYIISNTQGLIDRDIPLIHCIISNTKINGVSLNIEQLNQSLKLKLEKALSALSKPETSMNCSDSNKIYKKYKEEKCYKCKSNCKSRAALCLNGHWIHYMCDKLYNGR
jgi:hypothetical protein